MKHLFRPISAFAVAALLYGFPCNIMGQTPEEIHQDLVSRQAKTKCQSAERALAQAKDDETRRALEFLYAYMATPDWTDYSPEYFAEQAACAVRARKKSPRAHRPPKPNRPRKTFTIRWESRRCTTRF